MPRRANPKKMLKLTSRFFNSLTKKARSADAGPEHDRLAAKVVGLIDRCVDQAFRDAKLNQDNDDDWKMLATLLALSTYSGRGAGHPQVWSVELLTKLADDIQRLKAEDVSRRDKDCSKLLIKRAPYNELVGRRGNPITASTLLRRLPEARALRELQEAKSG